MNAKLFKRAAAGAVALTMLGVILPADSDLTGLSDGAALTASAADASAVFGEPTAEGGYVLENKTYTLTDDINTSSYIHVPDGVTAEIDMNGCIIDRELTEFASDGNVIQVDKGGVLTITDSSEAKTGTIKGGYTYDGAVAYGYANVNSDLDPAEVFRCVGNYSASYTIDENGNAHAKHSGFVYIDRSWDGAQKKVVEELKTVPADSYRFPETKNNPEGDDFIDLGSPNGEWYVVDHDITVDYTVRCFGSPHILLCDGATLTCSKGIICENEHSVHIYGQSDDSGRLYFQRLVSGRYAL